MVARSAVTFLNRVRRLSGVPQPMRRAQNKARLATQQDRGNLDRGSVSSSSLS